MIRPVFCSMSLVFSNLLRENFAELGRQREIPSFSVLGLARLEPEPTGFKIDVMLLAREYLGRDPPSGDVGSMNYRLKLLRKMFENGSVFVCLKESFASVVLAKHRDFWALDDFPDLLAQPESAFQRG